MITRRECLRHLTAGTGVALFGAGEVLAQPAGTYKGVVLGVQSYSFRDRGWTRRSPRCGSSDSTSCELWQGHLEPTRVDAGRDAQVARDDAAFGFQAVTREVREGRRSDLRLQHQLQGRLQRRRNRAGLRHREGARHQHHHRLGQYQGGGAGRAGCGASKDGRRRCTTTRGSTRTNSPRRDDFTRAMKPVTAASPSTSTSVTSRPRTSTRWPSCAAPRAHRHPAHQGSEAERGTEHAVRRGRYADWSGAAAAARSRSGRFPPTSSTNTRAATPSRKCAVASSSAGAPLDS